MKLPNIVFRKMTLEENISFVKESFYEDGDSLSLHQCTIESFPELKKYNLDSNKDEVNSEIERVIKERYSKLDNEIEEKVKKYNEIWNEYNDRYFEKLFSYLEVEFPKEIKNIDASVGILPVCPRYLDQYSFSVSIEVPYEIIPNICAHETLHFAWFLKWRELYPDIPKEEYESPYLCWKYSEMVTDPILNNEPFLSEFNFNERGYNSFYELYDGNYLVMDNLRKLYSKDISINEKIIKGYNYISEYYNNNYQLE